MSNVDIKRAMCTFCPGGCGVLVHVKDGKITKIEGNREHPVSRGFTCERMKYAIKWLYHPEQLKYPLKRAGERGENKWQRITWEQALDEIAGKLGTLKEKYGPETLVVTEGTLRGALFWMSSRFCYLFGNPHNMAHPGLSCNLNRHSISNAIVGCKVIPQDTTSVTLIRAANCIVFWGLNHADSKPRPSALLTQERHKRHIKTIVVDPRVTKDAASADMHLQLRPGTDCALAMGWVNVIINEQLYDKDFVNNWTIGFDRLAERAQEYPPQKVAEITGLTVDEIVESARMYATSKPASILGGLATDMLGLNGTRVEQVNIICQALTGNIDIRGGSVIPAIGPRNEKGRFRRGADMELRDRLPEENKQRQLGVDRFKLMTWEGYDKMTAPYEKLFDVHVPTMHRMGISAPLVWRAILTREPYPVTAIINWESNPLMWAANTKIVHEAMKSSNLELFVVNEYWMTPTALLADYVLPIASWMERAHIDTWEDFSDTAIGGEKAIEPLAERKDDYYFWRGLGMRLGQKEYWPWETREEHIAYQLEPMGITYEEFIKTGFLRTPYKEKKYEKYGFATPSGKLELCPSILEELGYDPLPYYEEPAESPVRTPEVAKEYPFILITGGRFMPQYHSEFRHWGMGAREKSPEPIADINTKDAKKLSIRNGDWIYIETRRGRIKQKARVSNKIKAGVVNVQSSWWFPEMPAEEPSLHGLWESNANVLTIDEPDCCDPLTGGWQGRALLCKVYKT
jgi:thiosulfate reductase/polysulfide reductase chain A